MNNSNQTQHKEGSQGKQQGQQTQGRQQGQQAQGRQDNQTRGEQGRGQGTSGSNQR